MKKTYAILAFLCCASLGHAAGKALQIEFNDGNKAVYALAKQPTVTFDGPDFTIKSTDAETSYPRADVKNFTFVNVDAGVGTVGTTTYTYSDNVFGCEGHQIEVFDLSGSHIAAGVGSVSLTQLPAGVYVVRANNHSIKVVKK